MTYIIHHPDRNVTAEQAARDFAIDAPLQSQPLEIVTLPDYEYGDAFGVRNRQARPYAKRRTRNVYLITIEGVAIATHTSKPEARRHKNGKPVITWNRSEREYRVWRFATFRSFSIKEYGGLSAAREAAEEHARAEAVR